MNILNKNEISFERNKIFLNRSYQKIGMGVKSGMEKWNSTENFSILRNVERENCGNSIFRGKERKIDDFFLFCGIPQKNFFLLKTNFNLKKSLKKI